MNRAESIKLILELVKRDDIIIAANGMISRELYFLKDRPRNFYMLGSMGLAGSIGLGVSLINKKDRIFIFDGDGNLLMNLAGMANIANSAPKNFYHIVFDNESYATTGGQPSLTKYISLEKVAESIGYKNSLTSDKKNQIASFLRKKGSSLLVIKVSKGSQDHIGRVQLAPEYIADRFRNALERRG